MTFDVPSELDFELGEDKVKFKIDDVSTNWITADDLFIKRIAKSNLNQVFLKKHLKKEIEIKNILDEGISFLESKKYSNAINCLDEVLFYDSNHAEALINKSFCFKDQKHFVKSLRYYKKSINEDKSFQDNNYYKELLKQANNERSNFPKIKLNIYAGDEYFSKGDFQKALDSYNRALLNPSKFKEKILNKLLNKKGTTLIKLNEFEEALICFKNSKDNDYAYFAQGVCEYHLGLNVNEKFKTLLSIGKEHMLKQALILNELELFDHSLRICDYLMENHFRVDNFYHNLLNAKKSALLNLNEDFSYIDEVISQLYG